MARTRSFDEIDVLDAAMHAFRRHGFAGISIKQLEEATGLTSGSLYNAYGNKEGLFRAALDHYVETLVDGRLAIFASEDASLEVLEGLFSSILEPPLSDGFGCLAVNSAMEFGSGSSIARAGVDRALDHVEAAVLSVLTREIGPEHAPAAAGRLMLIYQGLLVLSRSGRPDTGMAAAIASEFDDLGVRSGTKGPRQRTVADFSGSTARPDKKP